MDRNGRVTYDTCAEDSHVGQIFEDFDPAATMTMDNYSFQDFHGSFSTPVLTASAPIRSPDTATGTAGGQLTVGAPQIRPRLFSAGTVSCAPAPRIAARL